MDESSQKSRGYLPQKINKSDCQLRFADGDENPGCSPSVAVLEGIRPSQCSLPVQLLEAPQTSSTSNPLFGRRSPAYTPIPDSHYRGISCYLHASKTSPKLPKNPHSFKYRTRKTITNLFGNNKVA